MKKITVLLMCFTCFAFIMQAQNYTIEEQLRLNAQSDAPQLEIGQQNTMLSGVGGPCDQALVITSGNIVNEPLVCGPGDLLNSGNVTPFCIDDNTGAVIPASYGNGVEATYTYTPGTDGPVTITVSNTTWAAIFVYDGCPVSGGNCVAATRSTTATRTVNFTAVANTEYFIWIDTWPAPASPCTNGGLLTLSGPEPAGGGGGGDSYIVDFEGDGETKTGYASGTVNLSGLDWNMTEGLIALASSPDPDYVNGLRSARMRGYGTSSISMLEDKAGGLGEISFDYRRYGTDLQVEWIVEYSTDQGDNWIQAGDTFTALASDVVQTFNATVEVEGDVRIRIRTVAETGTSNRRLNLDDIELTDFAGGGGGGNNWECADAISLTCGDVVTGTTVGATNSGGNIAPDVFYSYTGSGTLETITLSLCDGGTNYDSWLRVFSDCTFTNQIASNDDFCGLQSQLTFESDGVSTYIIMVEGFGSASGNYSLAITCVAGAPFPSPYCGPLSFTAAVEPISRVIVADIDNASSAALNGSPGHEDFTSIVGTMQQGESYSIALEGNTGGNFENRFVVFIDWNQNGILDDAGEVYEMNNTITNSTGLDGQQALGNIVVPEDALEGETRMRVKKIWGTANFLNPCLGAGFGQAEDYTINVVGPDPCLVQMFPFTETFEANSPSRDCWTQIQEVGSGNWTFATGSSGGAITTANSGTLNARFVSSPGNATPITKLVSPPMNLEALGEAEMTFFYGQEVWFGDQNQLKVYYRVNANSAWVEIASYLNNTPSWTQATVTLPNVSSTYQIAFEGINNWGRANVVDDVTIYAAPPPNDLIQNAISVTNLDQPYTDEGVRLQYATNELLNPSGCNIAGTNGVWYSFTAAYNGSAEASVTSPAGVTAVIFYEAPNENVANETQLTFLFDMQNQCAPSTSSSIPTLAGQSYYIFVLNNGGSSDVVIDISESLGTDDNTIDGFVFYPNPADNVLNLKSNVTIDQVELFTVLGQSVLTRSINAASSQLDISRLSTGVYLMRVTADGQTATYQVIKR
jgi:hypothetical protein